MKRKPDEINPELVNVLRVEDDKFESLTEFLNLNTLKYIELKYVYKIAIRSENVALYQFIQKTHPLNDDDRDAFFCESINKRHFLISHEMLKEKINFNFVNNKNTQRVVLNNLSSQTPLNYEMMDLFFKRHSWSEKQLIQALDDTIDAYALEGFNYLMDKLSYKLSDETFLKHLLRKTIESTKIIKSNYPNYNLDIVNHFLDTAPLSKELATNALMLCCPYTPLNVFKLLLKHDANINNYEILKTNDLYTGEEVFTKRHTLYNNLVEMADTWGKGELFEFLKSKGLDNDPVGIFNMLRHIYFDPTNPLTKWFIEHDPQVLIDTMKNRKQEEKKSFHRITSGEKAKMLIEQLNILEEKLNFDKILNEEKNNLPIKKGMKI